MKRRSSGVWEPTSILAVESWRAGIKFGTLCTRPLEKTVTRTYEESRIEVFGRRDQMEPRR